MHANFWLENRLKYRKGDERMILRCMLGKEAVKIGFRVKCLNIVSNGGLWN